jgi:signal transduction histidine kinase
MKGVFAMRIFSCLKVFFLAIVLSHVWVGVASSADRGSAAEAEAMTKRAVAYLKANGSEKAAQEFTNGTSFKDRDLYVSYYDLTGKVLGHGANPKLVGKDLIGLKDPDGKLFIQMITDLAKTKGKGWTATYKFRDPTTDKIAEKLIYVERVDDSWVGVGIYK